MHDLIFKSTCNSLSINQQKKSDVFFLVSQDAYKTNYRVLPRGFKISSSPKSRLRFSINNEELNL